MARCTGSLAIATAVRTVTLSRSWSTEPQASLLFPKANDTPVSEAAGMVVTEMNTPIKVADGAGIMLIGGLVEVFLGVQAAGKSLEQVTKPLTSTDQPATATQAASAPAA
jgi:hypothetical protein